MLTSKEAGKNAKSYWTVKNYLHGNSDVNFKEDSSLPATDHAAENLVILRRLASTLIRIDFGRYAWNCQAKKTGCSG